MLQYRALPVYFIGIKPLVCHSPGPYLYTLLVSNLWCVTVQGPTCILYWSLNLWCVTVQGPTCILYWYQTSGVSQSRTLPVYFIGIKPLVCHSPGPYLYTLLVSKPLVCHSPGPYLYTLLVSNLWCVTVQGPTCILYGSLNLWCVTVQGPTCILYWYQTSGVSQSRALPVYFIGIKPLVCHSPGPYLYTLLVSKPLVCHSPGPYLYTLLVSNLWCVTVQDPTCILYWSLNLWCVTVQGPTCILYWSLNLWCVTVQGPTCILYWYQTSGVSQSRALPVYFIGIKPLVCHSPGPYLYTLLVSNLWCVTVQDPTCILYWSLNLWCVTVQGPTCILYWYQTSGVSQSRTLPVYFIGL